MDEYIERQALLDKLKERDLCLCVTEQDIKDAPVADVAPVRHGRCKKSDGKDEWYTYYYTCVECGANMMVADADYHDVSPNYCPNCGAKMDLEEV